MSSQIRKAVHSVKQVSDATIGRAANAVVETIIIRPHASSRSTPTSKSKERLVQELEECKAENFWLHRRVLDLEMQLQKKKDELATAIANNTTTNRDNNNNSTNNNNNNEFAGLPLLRAGTVRVGKKLGQGSFGAVYKGQWRGVRCALKFVPQETVDELRKEVSIMDKIDHPNIVRLYGVVVQDNDSGLPDTWPVGLKPPCVLMEYMGYMVEEVKVTCTTFIEYLKATTQFRDEEGDYYWIMICGMLQGAAKGLGYLHSLDILHRDIKGTNLLLDSRGNLRIADFGLATVYINGPAQHKSLVASWKAGPMRNPSVMGLTTAAGTYTHMAPEVMNSGLYGTAADIFSFGICISEALMGSEAEDIVDETRTPEFGLDGDKVRKLGNPNNCHVFNQLTALAVQCCNHDPAARPSADMMVNRIQEFLLTYQREQLRMTSNSSHHSVTSTSHNSNNNDSNHHNNIYSNNSRPSTPQSPSSLHSRAGKRTIVQPSVSTDALIDAQVDIDVTETEDEDYADDVSLHIG
jgi:serine/threonine protein kinase